MMKNESWLKLFKAIGLLSIVALSNIHAAPVIQNSQNHLYKTKELGTSKWQIGAPIFTPVNPNFKDPKPGPSFVPPKGDPLNPEVEKIKNAFKFTPPVGDPGDPDWVEEKNVERNHEKFIYDPRDPLYFFDPHSMSEKEFQDLLKWQKTIAAELATMDEEHEQIKEEAEAKDRERFEKVHDDRKREQAEAKYREERARIAKEEAEQNAAAAARERKQLQVEQETDAAFNDRMIRESEMAKQRARDSEKREKDLANEAKILKKAAEFSTEQTVKRESKEVSQKTSDWAARSREQRLAASEGHSLERVLEAETRRDRASVEAQHARDESLRLKKEIDKANNESEELKKNIAQANDKAIANSRIATFYDGYIKVEKAAQIHRNRIIDATVQASNVAGGKLYINSTYRLPFAPTHSGPSAPDRGVQNKTKYSSGHYAGAVDIGFTNYSVELAHIIIQEAVDSLGGDYFGLLEEVVPEKDVNGKTINVQYNTFFHPGSKGERVRQTAEKSTAEGTHMHIAPCLVKNHCPRH
ncbi:hypothetical protein N7D90_24485 (plasmid) [Pseudomonas fragi]|uniref:hypothetical protein n=1 Tax=Pseudomonas fragi TaxID=296 RepID=UPI0021C08AB3|nr:hypothetical protein [Pseudomonas fragi]UXL41020.1 hypothetical protein N7D90_24485 [Pseudomonas fragi]